jgi:uncharacterized protein YndB with AHSA1/START domain
VSDAELTFTRVLPAPRELVFECLTDPEHLTAFWGPRGVTAPLDGIVVELRVGGRFETLMVNDADGSTYRMRAIFDEITPPERLRWTEVDSGMVTITTCTDLGNDHTELRIEQRRVPDAVRRPQAQAGFLTSLDRFEHHLVVFAGKDSS